jgi:hypothetical protein
MYGNETACDAEAIKRYDPEAGCARTIRGSTLNECQPAPALVVVRDRLESANDRMASHVGRLESAMDRLAGVAPAGCPEPPTACDTNGHVDAMHAILDRTDRLLSRLDTVADRAVAAV